VGATLAPYKKPLGLGLGLLVVWVGSSFLADDPPAAAQEKASPAASGAPVATATEAARPTKPSKPGAYVPGPVTEGGTVRVRCVLSRAFDVVEVPLNKDMGPSKCGHDSMKSERAVYDPATLALANCVVWLDIKAGKSFSGDLAEAERTVTLDQKGCRYVPHIMLVRPGAKVSIKNSDPVQHNAKGFFNTKASLKFNVMSSSNGVLPPNDDTTLDKAGNYVVNCDIHHWMTGYIRAVPHPYYGVSGLDGTVLLTDVPPGTYSITCWHEGMGMEVETTGAQISSYRFTDDFLLPSQEVTVTTGGTVDVPFTIDPR
jgi:plastocyanin